MYIGLFTVSTNPHLGVRIQPEEDQSVTIENIQLRAGDLFFLGLMAVAI
jgi:hypothetical protein